MLRSAGRAVVRLRHGRGGLRPSSGVLMREWRVGIVLLETTDGTYAATTAAAARRTYADHFVNAVNVTEQAPKRLTGGHAAA
jgi:hypothetical protein